MKFADRVQETTTTTGTGTVTLGGAVTDYQAFGTAFPAATSLVAYLIDDGVGNWEVGLGTYTLSGTTLSRTTVLASSTGSAISFAAGTKKVSCVFPAQAGQSRGEGALVDASTVAVDATSFDHFYLLATSGIGATRKLGNMTGLVAGQSGTIIYQQDASGSRLLTFDTNYVFASGVPFVASTGANQYDMLGWRYSASIGKVLITQGKAYA